MPWETATKASHGKVWRHEVFAGVYDLSKVRDILTEKYGNDDPEAAQVRGQSALFACTVDANGYFVPESGFVWACAWAISQAERGKPTLTGFRDDAESFTEELRNRTGAGKLLADSIRDATPEAVTTAVFSPRPVRSPRQLARSREAWPASSRSPPSARRTRKARKTTNQPAHRSLTWIKHRSPARTSSVSPKASPTASASPERSSRGTSASTATRSTRTAPGSHWRSTLASERTAVARAITRLPSAEQEYAFADTACEDARARLADLRARLPEIERRLANAERDWRLAHDSLDTHRRGRPGWLAFLSPRGRQAKRAWETQRAELGERFTAADRERVEAQRAAGELNARMGDTAKAESEAASDLGSGGAITCRTDHSTRRPSRW